MKKTYEPQRKRKKEEKKEIEKKVIEESSEVIGLHGLHAIEVQKQKTKMV